MYKVFCFCIVFFSILSCSEKKQQQGDTASSEKEESLLPPKTVLISPAPRGRKPASIISDTCKSPHIIPLPKTGVPVKPCLTGGIGGGFGNFTNFNTEQGLCLSSVRCSFTDKMGNLWFGTSGGGVCRYDGKAFTTFTIAQGLANNQVMCITEDKTGNIWFGTEGGGISRYDGKSFSSFSADQGFGNNTIWSIFQDRSGIIWIGTDGGGVSQYDGHHFTSFNTNQGLASTKVYSIYEDTTGNIWFGTNGGVSCYNSRSNAISNFTTAQGLASNLVHCIAGDKAGNLWFGTYGGGVSCYDGFSFVNFSTLQGLANNTVYSITMDRSENLWFSTNGGGISRYNGNAVTSYTTEQGLLNNQVFGIISDKAGNLWFATDGGVNCYDGHSFKSFRASEGLANNHVLCAAADHSGNLWFGTIDGGVSRYDGNSFSNYKTEQCLGNNRVNAIMVDESGKIWFGTNGGGVSCYNDSIGRFINLTTAQGIPNNSINCIAQDLEGNLWFGTNGGGVSRYDGKSFTNFTSLQGLAGNIVLSSTMDKKGNLWLGTDGNGISVISASTISKLNSFAAEKPEAISFFNNFSTKQGLSDDVVYAIVEDKQDNIVIGTNLGFTIIKGGFDPLRKSGQEAMEIYNTKTGYPVKDINSNGMFCDTKGIIWAGTGDKLVRFDYNALHKNPEPMAVVIQSIKIDEESISWYDLHAKFKGYSLSSSPNTFEELSGYGRLLSETERRKMVKKFANVHFDSISRFYPLPQNLQLPYIHNHITFEYTAIEPARPDLIKYQYILEGYSKEWSSVTKKTAITFGNIYEGTYTFKLKAESPEGIWTEPSTYTFKVLPPWYRTWWGFSGYLLISIFVIWALLYWRTTTLRKDKLKLETLVRERTAEVLKQKQLVETKNQQITSSITYAKHIQDSFLLSEEAMKSLIPYESFVFFQPKDIVSGDFYWFSSLIQNGMPVYVLVAADCTGHGVPGAFMSMLGSLLLNKIVNENKITNPAKILMEIHHGIFNSLHREDASSVSQDGMDVSICTIEPSAHKITYAGAMNPLYVLRQQGNGQKPLLEEIKPAVFSLGDKIWNTNAPIEVSFPNHNIPFEKGMTLYLFSDGYIDQYQQDGKNSFGSQRFRKLLTDSSALPLKEQKEALITELEAWRGGTTQLDDILVIGIRL